MERKEQKIEEQTDTEKWRRKKDRRKEERKLDKILNITFYIFITGLWVV